MMRVFRAIDAVRDFNRWLSLPNISLIFLVRIGPIIIGCIMGVVILVIWLVCRRTLPDLTTCTRIEIHYASGALDYFFPDTFMQKTILSATEREYVRSYDKWTVTEPEQIRAFAHRISQGEYRGRLYGVIDEIPTNVILYQGSNPVASFAIYRQHIVLQNRCRFAYPPALLSLSRLDPPAIKPLKCDGNVP